MIHFLLVVEPHPDPIWGCTLPLGTEGIHHAGIQQALLTVAPTPLQAGVFSRFFEGHIELREVCSFVQDHSQILSACPQRGGTERRPGQFCVPAAWEVGTAWSALSRRDQREARLREHRVEDGSRLGGKPKIPLVSNRRRHRRLKPSCQQREKRAVGTKRG